MRADQPETSPGEDLLRSLGITAEGDQARAQLKELAGRLSLFYTALGIHDGGAFSADERFTLTRDFLAGMFGRARNGGDE